MEEGEATGLDDVVDDASAVAQPAPEREAIDQSAEDVGEDLGDDNISAGSSPISDVSTTCFSRHYCVEMF